MCLVHFYFWQLWHTHLGYGGRDLSHSIMCAQVKKAIERLDVLAMLKHVKSSHYTN